MGGEIAAQSAVNANLKNISGSAMLASTISFFVGSSFLTILLLVMQPKLPLTATLITDNPWWMWLGGLTSAFALTTNIVLFARLGSVQTAVLPIVGQIIMSVIIDQFGLFHSPSAKLTLLKFIGVLILLLGAGLSANVMVKKSPIEQVSRKTSRQWFWQLLGLIAGAGLAVQAAVNGYLGHVLNSSALAAWLTCLVVFIILLIVTLLKKVPIVTGLKKAQRQTSNHWWLWIGGLLGSSYVMLSAQLVPLIGTGKVIVIALFGQLTFSALIDNFGWFAAPKQPITRLQLLGLNLMLVAIIVVNWH